MHATPKEREQASSAQPVGKTMEKKSFKVVQGSPGIRGVGSFKSINSRPPDRGILTLHYRATRARWRIFTENAVSTMNTANTVTNVNTVNTVRTMVIVNTSASIRRYHSDQDTARGMNLEKDNRMVNEKVKDPNMRKDMNGPRSSQGKVESRRIAMAS